MIPVMWRAVLIALGLLLLAGIRQQDRADARYSGPCAPDAIGTSRTLWLNQGDNLMQKLKRKDVVLSYDDGPDAQETVKLLNLLAQECIQAVFFPRGDNAAKRPALVRRILAEGHMLGGHGWSHRNLARISFKDARNQIDRGNQAIEAALNASDGADPPFRLRFFRYPFLQSNEAVRAYTRQLGLIAIGVQADSRDWRGAGPTEGVDIIMRKLHQHGEKGVILMHPPAGRADQTTKLLIDRLKVDGYRIVAIKPARSAVRSSDQTSVNYD